MGKRRDGREAAVQFLFQRDLNAPGDTPSLDDFWQLRPTTKTARLFGDELIQGVLTNQAAIDERIQKCVANYELNRIAAVDRNVLRVAIYEMVYTTGVPPVVCINEAIEIAKRFGSDESGRFINGVLDRIRHDLPRPARTVENPNSK